MATTNRLEHAIAAQVLVASESGDTVRFYHALTREALYEAMLPPRRRAWHRAIGEALAALPAPAPDAVAHHFERAGDPGAVRRLRDASYRAQVIAENRARGNDVTDAELIELSRKLPGQADDLERQSRRMREQSARDL